ncbi:glycosyltransferase [Amylibacter sp.]|nr:glycosyltransferase [Amylibacter sp.]
MSKPLISIIIPTYNHSRYLGRALQSIYDQTYGNWEAIIVDNHSTDDTSDVVKKFDDPRVSYFKIHNNGIIAASRNMGINAAKGNWLAFLDSDDWWSANKLEICSKYIDDNLDLIHHDLDLVYDQPSFFRRHVTCSRQLEAPVLKDLLTKGNAIVNSSVIVRRKLLTKIGGISEDKNMVASEDYNTWLKIAALTDRFRYLPKSLGCYQVHSNGISQQDMSKSDYAAIAEFKDQLTPDQLCETEKLLSYVSGRFNYLKKEYALAELALKKALPSKNFMKMVKVIAMLAIIFIIKKL